MWQLKMGKCHRCDFTTVFKKDVLNMVKLNLVLICSLAVKVVITIKTTLSMSVWVILMK